MKKAIFICLGIFIVGACLVVLLFGETKIKNNTLAKDYKYEQSPLYKGILKKNNSIIYINIWASYSPDSVERYKDLEKDSNKIVYNFSLEKDSAAIKNAVEKFGIKNDITLENYNYRDEILKNLYSDRSLSLGGGVIKISDYKLPVTFTFDKQVLKEKF